jgi:hypothetical protein
VLGAAFLLIFSIPSLATAAWRVHHEHTVESQWIGTAAMIDKRWLAVHQYHALSSNKAYIFGDEFYLRCRLRYEFARRQYVFNLSTLSSSSDETRVAIEKWVKEHRPGAFLDVKVNPSHPDELAVVSELPIPQSGTSRQAWSVGLYCGVGGVLLAVAARILIRPWP